jgi:hypothetical protein
MSKPLGTYSFLPWLRQGLANQIQSPDFDANVKLRASVNVQLELKGDGVAGNVPPVPVNKPVGLFGPGDIVGIDHRAVVRVSPRNWIANFEPNYLAHIEFYDEDFPHRYTPAAPNAIGRLRPWITLIVLTETEFTERPKLHDRPLPYIDVTSLAAFPRADELWAWAHVHINENLAANDDEFVSTDMNAVIPKVQAVLQKNPDLAYSRLICPRKLAPNTAYHAFVVPTFEVGRRAGLNLDLEQTPATMSAWDPAPRPEGQSFPYYYRWFFRTGESGDFESLVRLLVPKPVDPRVGTRPMDVQDPGAGVDPLDKPELGGILKLGGALLPPSKVPPEPPDMFETWDVTFPRPLQEDLIRLINLADDYEAAGDPDPIITPPLYGRWHALRKRVITDRDGNEFLPVENWIHRLNLDPRFRVAAGFGTRVIQDNQEKYMDAAWEQIGRVLEARKRIFFGQFALATSAIWYDSHLLPTVGVSKQQTLLLMAPLNKRILTQGLTVQHTLANSLVQPAMTSAALRRIIRPRGRLIQTLPFDATHKPADLLHLVNEGIVSAAPPKETPEGVLTLDQGADLLEPQNAPGFIKDWLRRWPWLPLLVFLIAFLLALIAFLLLAFGVAAVVAIILLAVAIALYLLLRQWRDALQAADLLRESELTPESIENLPPVSDFHIAEIDSGFTPVRFGTTDSFEATKFKKALVDAYVLIGASAEVGRPKPKNKLDLTALATTVIEAVDPKKTIPGRVMSGIFVPPRIVGGMVPRPEVFIEPMAYPIIDEPMYKPLTDRSEELFLPNINLIEHNSITLLETNDRFIESYMVGLNHEFARELLWREYPTDQRGSTFRQFWDVSTFFNTQNLDDEKLKEKLRDIKPLHEWSLSSLLGKHNNRTQTGKDLVLVIRGELLKRYPTAVIYAHRACWQRKSVTPADPDKEPCERSGVIDNRQERRLVGLTAAEEDKPPPAKVRTPLYMAKVDPDIYFLGFDLDVDEAKGGTGADPNDDPGWFFVIKERPGEPHFGLDIEAPAQLNVWNDLSWPQVQPGIPGTFIEIATAPPIPHVSTPGSADEKFTQFEDDQHVHWTANMNSAELAYILWQAPVLVAVHASEMLPK